MNQPLEKDVQKQIIEYLQSAGCTVIRVNSGMTVREYKGKRHVFRANSEPGCADLLVCVPMSEMVQLGEYYADTDTWGEFLALEVKRPPVYKKPTKDQEATDEQKSFGERLAQSGGNWQVVWSVKQVRDILQEMGADNVPPVPRTVQFPPSPRAGRSKGTRLVAHRSRRT